MWQYKHTDELYLYGIPGMKWGQRRAQKKTYSDKELSDFRKRKILEAKNSGVKGARVGSAGWWKNAPKSTIARAYKEEQKAIKKNNTSNKKWSTKKKIAVGVAATTALVAGAYGTKKAHDYIRSENSRIASIKASKAYKTSLKNWTLKNGSIYNKVANKNGPTAQRLGKYERIDLLNTMHSTKQQTAQAAYNRTYNKHNNVTLGRALSNVINDKRNHY